jgi:hypothetical protein
LVEHLRRIQHSQRPPLLGFPTGRSVALLELFVVTAALAQQQPFARYQACSSVLLYPRACCSLPKQFL